MSGAHKLVQTVLAYRYMFTASPQNNSIPAPRSRTAGHNAELKLVEVIHFLLIVREISVPAVIMRARKLERLEWLFGGGEGLGIWLDRYANTVTRLGLSVV